MTNEQEERLNEQLNALRKDLTAVVVQNGMLKAELRAFRDMVCEFRDKPNLSGDKLFDYWALKAGEYYATVETDSATALSHLIPIVKVANEPRRG